MSNLQFIIIEAVSIDRIPRNDVADWRDEVNGVRAIQVADLGNPDYTVLLAIHQVIQQHLCARAGITAAQVDAYDTAHPGAALEVEKAADCPYREAHERATWAERHVAAEMGIDWDAYQAWLEAIHG